MCIGFLGENRPNFSRKAAIWQLSDDPEDRARLRLMLDSLRPPARSRAHPGSSDQIISAPATMEIMEYGNIGVCSNVNHRVFSAIFRWMMMLWISNRMR